MAVSKAPQAFKIEPMRSGDLDAVSHGDRAGLVPLALVGAGVQGSEEMARDWARVDVVCAIWAAASWSRSATIGWWRTRSTC